MQIATSGTIEVFTSTGTLVESFGSGSPQISVTGSTVSFSTTSSLSENTAYYVHISPGFIQDLSGNNFSGITTNTLWNFTVGDFTGPTISSLNPADNSINVLLTVNPSVTFNETPVLGAGSFFLVNEAGGTTEEFNSLLGNAVVSGNMVTLNTALDFESSANYHVLIDNDAIEDMAGNSFAGIADTTSWSFSTELEMGLQELSMNEYSWSGKELLIQADYSEGQIIDAGGKLIRRIYSKKTVLDNLPAGIYTVRLQQNNRSSFFRIYVD